MSKGSPSCYSDRIRPDTTLMRQYFVYILTNKYNTVLYIGVTNNLERRILEHKQKQIPGFTKKYNCTKLVYFEETNDVISAIAREKQLKNWHRDWKKNLISEFNPNWDDLASS
jgi:putative endonuclease